MNRAGMMFLTFGCSVTWEHIVFEIKYNAHYLIKLDDSSFFGKIHDVKSHNMLKFMTSSMRTTRHCLRISSLTLVNLDEGIES